ncbi:MAG: class I SAM-dependent methyltransferase, partial [Gemmatimonadetes bacterium]
ANGDGLAFLWPWRETREAPLMHRPTVPALLPGPRRSALVLFAGAGADMMSLRENGYDEVTGVELNPTIVEAGLALDAYRLKDFLALDGVRLAVDDGRAFLERDRKRYDLVLLSWSGATAAYHLGALAGTTEHMFTHEGLSAAFDRLKPDGFALVLQISKVNAIDTLRRYMAARGLPAPERSAIILFRPEGVHAWDGPWEDNPLLFKPSGWSEDEVAAILARATARGYEVAYAPGRPPHPDFTVYERLLTAADPAAEIGRIESETGLRFGAATDDRPFYLDQFLPSRYLSAEFWGAWRTGFRSPAEIYHFMRVAAALAVSAAAFALALAPLLLVRRST